LTRAKAIGWALNDLMPRRPNASRRRFISQGLTVGALGLVLGCGRWPLPGAGRGGLSRVGYLESGVNPAAYDAFREALLDLGYVEGEHVVLDRRDAARDFERLPSMAAELVSLSVDVIVVVGGPAIVAASQATSTIPIVTAGSNVITTGLVSNLARPEGNITGVASNAGETVVKWVELLKETVPGISYLAVVYDRASRATDTNLPAIRAAESFGLHARAYDVPSLDQLPIVLATARADGANGVMVQSGGVFGGAQDSRIGQAIFASGLPAVGESRLFAVSGGLLAHGSGATWTVRRTANYVDRILRGARPGDLPIEVPTTFEIVVNQRAARALGIEVPSSVLLRATEIID
jgi:putative tryptophan/tyrosine transport system substrate-binding protein